MTFSNSEGYKFVDAGGTITAVLDSNGRFTLKEETGKSIEVFKDWTDFVKSMGDAPTSGDETAVLQQLSDLGLGRVEPISRGVNGNGNSSVSKKPKETAEMATTKQAPAKQTPVKQAPAKAAKPASTKQAPAKASKPKGEKNNICICGCGEKCGGTFRMGHDARVHSWCKKFARGEMKMNEIPASAQAYVKAHAQKYK